MIGRALLGLAFAVLAAIGSSGSARAEDDYTLPFYDPAITLSYGVDRDARSCRQRDWTNKLWYDCSLHYGRVYDGHTGMDYPMALISPVAASRDGTVIDRYTGYGTQQFGTYGNFVLVSHADGRRTLYYHLAHDGAHVSVGQAVTAGQLIADSGCSGQCYGAHLHWEMRAVVGGRWTFVDPIYLRLFTTNPGRVPFLASYRRESNAGTEVIPQYATVTHWVEFLNTGGRAWQRAVSRGRTYLATWSPAGHASTFAAADWPSPWVATAVDQASVPPNSVGRFTFGLRASAAPGSYVERFDLLANGLRWFDWSRLGSFYIPIYVISHQVE